VIRHRAKQEPGTPTKRIANSELEGSRGKNRSAKGHSTAIGLVPLYGLHIEDERKIGIVFNGGWEAHGPPNSPRGRMGGEDNRLESSLPKVRIGAKMFSNGGDIQCIRGSPQRRDRISPAWTSRNVYVEKGVGAEKRGEHQREKPQAAVSLLILKPLASSCAVGLSPHCLRVPDLGEGVHCASPVSKTPQMSGRLRLCGNLDHQRPKGHRSPKGKVGRGVPPNMKPEQGNPSL